MPRRMLSLLMSRWITPLPCKNSRAWRHWIQTRSCQWTVKNAMNSSEVLRGASRQLKWIIFTSGFTPCSSTHSLAPSVPHSFISLPHRSLTLWLGSYRLYSYVCGNSTSNGSRCLIIAATQRQLIRTAQLTSLQTAAIWPSSIHVSVTTSVREPPARYSITTWTEHDRVVQWWWHKKYFHETMGFVQLFWTTYLRKVHFTKTGSLVHQTAEIWAFEVQVASY